MSGKTKGHPPATRYGISIFCSPQPETPGEASPPCIPLRDWCAEYHYTRKELKTLLLRGRIKAIRTKGRLYIEDREPDE